MTRKDFVKFAEVIKDLTQDAKPSMPYQFSSDIDRDDLIDRLIGVFMADNPNFSPSRFRTACNAKGVE